MLVPKRWAPIAEAWRMAPAALSDPFVFCSGVTGVDPDGRMSEDPDGQARDAFAALREVLAEAALDLADVVEITSYHTDIRAHFDGFRSVWAAEIAPPYPAWTAIGVSALATPGAVIELRAIARRPDRPARRES